MIFLNRRYFIKGISASLIPYSNFLLAGENRVLLSQFEIGNKDVLLVIDMQYDFCPGGSLAVKDGDSIIVGINSLQNRFQNIILSQDWHPEGHSSFFTSYEGKEPFSKIEMPYGEQTLWPPHCIMGTRGADFHDNLNILRARMVVRKGFRKEIDSYSAFWENDKATPTGLDGALKTMGIERVFVCGLALDFCVAYTAVDAAVLGYETYVIEDLAKPVNLPGTVEATYESFEKNGVKRIYMT